MIDKEKFQGQYRVKSTRLKNYDYSRAGYYYITICSYQRKNLFSKIIQGNNILTDIGKILDKQWQNLVKYFSYIKLDKYVIMPNHLHSIIILKNQQEIKNFLGIIIGNFKASCSREIKVIDKLWQERFYEHIIRDEEELLMVQEYIINNPKNWQIDKNNLEVIEKMQAAGKFYQ